MKIVFIFFTLLFSMVALAQEKVAPTSQFSVGGKVKSQLLFGFKDTAGYRTVFVDSLVIYNHLHERKRVVNNIKGILLKDILAKAVIDETSPKLLSEYYIICIASDGYTVVFSWNELFNTVIGDHILVATEGNGLKGEAMPDKMLLFSAMDNNTGRRFVKGLSRVLVKSAN